MINLTPKNKLAPGRGRLLISYPLMSDPNFKRTVILLCDHNENGSFGFVINKFIPVKLSDLVEDLPDIKTRIGLGGPVQTSNLYYLHTLGEKLHGSIEIAHGLFMGGDYDDLKEMLLRGEIGESELRFFVGYSGWSENQLASELTENSWIITEAPTKVLMNTKADKLWQNALIAMGKEYSFLANMPENPELN